MEHESHGLSDPGRARKENEDAILLARDLGLYVVCDGCGGQRAGAVASRMACKAIHEALGSQQAVLRSYAARPGPTKRKKVIELIVAAVNAASQQVNAAARSDADKAGMGTTVALAAVLGGRAVTAHAGDSRIYLFRGGRAHRLTEDHTLAGEYRRMGLLSGKQAKGSRLASMITRAVGRHGSAHVDTLHLELAGGDALLLCSDGLTRYVSDAEIAEALRKLPAAKAPDALVRAANRRGGADNVSVIVVRMPAGRTAADEDLVRRLRTLQRVPLFRHLSFQELLRVMDLVEMESYEPGNRVVSEGETSDRIFVSVAGTVEVVKNRRTLASLPAGSLFGEMGLIDEAPRSADVVARKGARLMVIRRKDFFALLRRRRTLAVKVLWGLCRVLNARLRRTSEKLSAMAVEDKLSELAAASRPFV